MKSTIFILIVAVFHCDNSNAQQIDIARTIDSLKKQLRFSMEDTSRIRVLNDLAENYQNNPNDSCLKYANIALSLSDKLLSTDAVKTSLAYTNTVKLLKAKALDNIAGTMEKTNTVGARDVYQKALDVEAETGNKRAMAETYEWIADMYESLNRHDDALKNYGLSVNLWREAGDKNQMAITYRSIAYLYYSSGNYNEAIKSFESSLNIFKENSDEHQMGDCYYWIGNCQRVLGHYGDGIESELNALQISQKIKDTSVITKSLLEMGSIYISIKDYREALKNYQAELNILQLRHDSSGIASVYSDIGYIKAEKGEFEEALNNYEAAIPILKKLKDYYNLYVAFYYLSLLYDKQGKYPEAIERSRAALQYAKIYQDKKFIAIAYNSIAELYMKASDKENALTNYYESYKFSDTFNLHKQAAFASLGIGRVSLSQGETTQAIAWLNKAAALTPPTEYILLRDIHQKLSEAYEKKNDFKNAFLSEVKFNQFSDSVTSKEKAEKLASLTNQLEFENKRALQKASQDKIIALRESEIGRQKLVRNVSLAGLTVFIVFAVIFFIRFREKRKLNIALEKTLVNLRNAQAQLIQQEKLASLGELTAGIAHEIQNPLNFVNNFSEVNNELIEEMQKELKSGNNDEAISISNDIKENEQKINHHGKRAGAIVKGMLQHSRTGTGHREPTDINALADEYLRLAYHGLRAKDKSFNATMKTDFDKSIGTINIIQQDIGRVLLNLYNNAFYAVNERSKQQVDGYDPTVSISTKKFHDKVEIIVKDNGSGIPQKVLDKIFQPFFTTKPTGQGTGLGLSLSYDIVKVHGGEIKVSTREGEFTEFVVQLPVSV